MLKFTVNDLEIAKKEQLIHILILLTFVILNFERWIASLGANADFNMLKQVILKEQFFNQVPEDLRLYLLDKNPNNLIDAAKRADE